MATTEFKDFDQFFKLMLIGDSRVGKTSIIQQFKDRSFINHHRPTVGIAYGNTIFKHDSKRIKLHLWDAAGHERFRSLTHAYYRGADVMILVYDIESRDSFQNIDDWMHDTKRYASNDVIVVLVGNKCDTIAREVNRVEGEILAMAKRNVMFLETSAKTGENIEMLFEKLANILLKKERTKVMEVKDDFEVMYGHATPNRELYFKMF